jgi:hypothetical protein
MLFDYSKMNTEDAPWILELKEGRMVSSTETIAVDAVIHDLNNGYFVEIDGVSGRTLEEDANTTYWSGDRCYTDDDVFRVFIDGAYYVLSSVYVTKNGRIVVEVVQPEDIWRENKYLACELDNLERILFLVEY